MVLIRKVITKHSKLKVINNYRNLQTNNKCPINYAAQSQVIVGNFCLSFLQKLKLIKLREENSTQLDPYHILQESVFSSWCLSFKNDFYKILAGVRHCCRFEALLIIVTSRCNFSLKIVNLKYTLKLTKSWSEQPFLN